MLSLVGLVLALYKAHDLLGDLTHRIARDTNDPLLQAWQVAWIGHALTTDPRGLWDANIFWPLRDVLAFSDSLLGYAPAGLIGYGPTAAVVRYDLLFVLAYAMAFTGAALLAREIGLRLSACLVAGAAFAYNSFRLSQDNHLNVLSSGGVPLALFLLYRGVRERRAGALFAGWCVATWQLSLGFNIGLPFAYLLAGLTALTGVLWLVRGRPRLARRLVLSGTAGLLLFVVSGALLALPYLRVLHDEPESRRSLEVVEFFSPPPLSLVLAPVENRTWGRLTQDARVTGTRYAPEQTLFPGVVVLALATAGLFATRLSRGWRIGLAGSAVVTAVFALGLRFLGGRFTYLLLYDHVPGFQGVRTPGRLIMFTELALSLLAAAGAAHLASGLQGVRAGRHLRWSATYRRPGAYLGAAFALLVLVEAWGTLTTPDVPPRPPGLDRVVDPVLHLPTDEVSLDNAYTFWSTDGFPRTVNGSSGIVPDELKVLRQEMEQFPDATSVGILERLGVRTVVLHTDRAANTPWEFTEARPTAGLPLEITADGDLVIYRLTG